jgi:predicted signal transduction protein with EAL and GGDEF domain
VARHGGEEFAVLMTGVSKERAARYAEELRQACAAKEILGEEISACVTISIGLAVCLGEADLAKVMRMADQALYAAKHRGRNRVVRADVLTGSIAASAPEPSKISETERSRFTLKRVSSLDEAISGPV